MDETAAFKRFISSLPGLRKVLPLALLLILFATLLPQFFLWYTGRLADCQFTQVSCTFTIANKALPVSTSGLWLIAILAISFRIVSWMVFELSGMMSTNVLFRSMMSSLSRSKITYFDTEATSRIVSRIIGDFGQLRGHGIFRLSDFINCLMEVIAIGLLIALVNPWPAMMMLPCAAIVIYIQIQIGSMRGNVREISGSHSAVLVHRINDLIEGSKVFNLFQKHDSLFRRIAASYGEALKSMLLLEHLQIWGRFWVNITASFFGFIVVLTLFWQVAFGFADLSLIAVVMSSVFALEGVFSFLSLSAMNLGESLGSARRVFALVDLPDEQNAERSPLFLAPIDRSSYGKLDKFNPPIDDLKFVDFHMSYQIGQPDILRGINLVLPRGQRIGFIGRTGSGKSSLMQALLRMVYVSRGDILVGQNSIYNYDIGAWRGLFSIVPQAPVLLEGTILSNLNVQGSYSESKVKNVLQLVGIDLGLNFPIATSGTNLSLGQRQLICLARAIISDRPYLILDEPTSSIDPETDRKVQLILRQLPTSITVLTIAHRLETLEGYDQIITMERGEVSSKRTFV